MGRRIAVDISPLPSSGRWQINNSSQARFTDRHLNDLTCAEDRIACLDTRCRVSITQLIRSASSTRKPTCPPANRKTSVEPHVTQAGDHRDRRRFPQRPRCSARGPCQGVGNGRSGRVEPVWQEEVVRHAASRTSLKIASRSARQPVA